MLMSNHRLARFISALVFSGFCLSPHAEARSSETQSAPPSTPLAEAVEHAKRATVGILNESGEDKNADYHRGFSVRGTGVHLKDGYLVTARHAVEREKGSSLVVPRQIMVLTQELSELPAQLVGDSAYVDVVLYRVNEGSRSQLPGAVSFSEKAGASGDEVFTVGYPLGWGPTIAFGRIGNTNTFLPTVDTRLLQADLGACSGNSGGGLFNTAGELVGVMHAIIQTDKKDDERHCSRLAFAVPSVLARRIVGALLEGKQPSFSRLGIHMTTVKVATRWRLAVKDVVEPAKSAGIQKGDLLMAIDDQDIADASQFKNFLIERTMPGQRVSVRVRRQDVDLTLSVVLGGG
jgi:serine protease Do